MEIFQPENFFQMADLLANVFTAAIAIAGLLIALATYKVATEALTTWKEQKNHEYEVLIHSNLKTLMNLITETYSLKTSYTSVYIRHSKEFRYSSANYNILEKSETLNSALAFIRMYDIQKKKNNIEIKTLLTSINSAVVGIKNSVISSIFYDIKDVVQHLDRVKLDLVAWIAYFKDTLENNKSSQNIVEIIDYPYFENQYKNFFKNESWEKELEKVNSKVDNYLRGKL
ncbi:hypothetical protein CHU00_18780 [Sphingobacterium cellulitidis]|uniref:hypothetical protein n=1 Tax=Sphingobacterium cellulitidis TaxID=1768011 RepID=UPI000B93E6D3|nr:hypothetical protein [Sphingobacterium cellulitidis]OYD44070.1 hypothetical protein CHU00_18780 [Sphingobacterium cellulitidis]